jgi:RNA polymerase primary sigma factor
MTSRERSCPYDKLMDECEPMKRGEEAKLKKKLKSDPEGVRMTLWKHNLRYAAMLANQKYVRKSNVIPVSLDDLKQTAILALWKASGLFDFNNGAKFISYAGWAIRRALEEHIRDAAVGFTTPRMEVLKQIAGKRFLETGQIHQKYPESQLRLAISRTTTPVFLDAPMESKSGTEDNLHSLLVGTESPVKDFDKNDRRQVLGMLMDLLARHDKRYPGILRARFGLDGEPQTLQEVARTLKITRERVRQLEEKALKRLRILAANRRIDFSQLTSHDDTQ